MNSTITKRTYKAIYRLLDRVSPIDLDCGALCGSVCCTYDSGKGKDGFSMGIYLLPGEEQLFTKTEDWLEWSYSKVNGSDFPDSWHGIVYFIRCKTPPLCKRYLRPMQCRTFPLAPHITDEGELKMILYPSKLPYKCPLIHSNIILDDRFVRATQTAWKHLIRDEYIYDLVKYDSSFRIKRKLKFV
jgi:hypothetical protein